ncbi:hypothetical protein TWF281_003220 [Arthrobotrys megalospora]
MRLTCYLICLIIPLLSDAFEVAFSPYNMYDAQVSFFAYKPLPQLNWSVYPRYRCNAINWEGFPKKNVGYVRSILFRSAEGTPAPIPRVVAFFEAGSDSVNSDLQNPCAWMNARIVVHIGENLNDKLGAIVKISPDYNRYLTHWMEIIPGSETPEWQLIQDLKMGNWRLAYRKTAYSDDWDVRRGEKSGISEIPIRWDPWYFASMVDDVHSVERDHLVDPEVDSDDELIAKSENGYNDGDISDSYEVDDSDSNDDGDDDDNDGGNDDGSVKCERTAYGSDEDEPQEPAGKRAYIPPQPEIIRGNPRWVYRPRTGCRGPHPEYTEWRNKRMRDAGEYNAFNRNVNPYFYQKSYDQLMDMGNIIDPELERQQLEEFKRQQEGVRAAELFYEALRDEINPDGKGSRTSEMFDGIWQWENPEQFQLEHSDPLQALLDLNSNADEDTINMNLAIHPSYVQKGRPPDFKIGDNDGLKPPPPTKPTGLKFRHPVEGPVHDTLSGPPSPDVNWRDGMQWI